jgi:hypothetical protein
VLYLDRPGSKSGIGSALCGRIRYSDLKEAALSGAADLWALNGLEVFLVGSGPEFWVCREDLRQVFMAAYELRNVVEGCRQAKTRAVVQRPRNGTRPSPSQQKVQPTPAPKPSQQTRPAPQNRPTGQSKPAPQNKPAPQPRTTNSNGSRPGQGQRSGGGKPQLR